MNLKIDKNWTFKNVIENIKTLRSDYERILASFSYFHSHSKILFIQQTKKQIYSFNFKEWKKDMIWFYLNNDIDFETLLSVL